MTELVPAYSQKLQQLIEEANAALKQYGKWKGEAKSKILGAYKQALSDGYTPSAAKTLLESKLSYSERYVRECLPSEAKQKQEPSLKQVYKVMGGTVPPENINTTSQPNDYDPNTVTITTKHDVIDPYEESQDKLNDLIKETQNQQLKPISEESPTERAKRLMQESGYDLDEDQEDLQIQINDIKTSLEQERSEKQRISSALNTAHERNKEQQEEIHRLQIELEKVTKTSPLDIPQTPHVCNTDLKAKTKIQLYLSKDLIMQFFKRQGIEHARDIPNMTIYGEITNYMKDDDLAIGKIGTIRSSI